MSAGSRFADGAVNVTKGQHMNVAADIRLSSTV